MLVLQWFRLLNLFRNLKLNLMDFKVIEEKQYFLNSYLITKMLPWCESSMMVPQSDLYATE